MIKIVMAAAVVALGMTPAMAQTDNSSTDTSTNALNSSDAGSMSTNEMVASQKKVLKVLEDAGYTDTSILDAAYMVEAKTPDGEQILMMIDTRGRVMGAQKSGDGSGSGANNKSSSSGSSAASDEGSPDADASKN